MIEDREIFRTVTIVDSFGREHRRIQRCAIEIRWTGGEPSSPPDATEVGEWMVLPVDSTPRFETLAKQFYRDTRVLAPGKDEASANPSGLTHAERRKMWDEWLD